MKRVIAALIAGGFAIVLNTLALRTADLIALPTARGGLLRLITPWLEPPVRASGAGTVWFASGGPGPTTLLFQTGFHLVVGLLMALFYAFLLEPILPGDASRKGLCYALLTWLLNAAVVLPLTGEGFAGSAHLTLAGMLWFAAAHTLFFLLLAWSYGWLMSPWHPASVRAADPDARIRP